MKAAVRDRFGLPEVVEVREVETPTPADDELLVRVRATSLNLGDWYAVTGRPYLARGMMGFRKPRDRALGTDFAGVVEAVGKDVTRFRVGDDVFGGRNGAWAEFVTVREERAVVPKPGGVTFEEAGAVPVAALTALQAARDKGALQPGQKVLVNGASGGVGTYAVQIAKALGGEVTAVCSTRNVEQTQALGADCVIDYTHEDFTKGGESFDLMLDIAGSRSWGECKRVLKPDANVVLIGGPKKSAALGPLGHLGAMLVRGKPGGRKVGFFIAKFNKADMAVLADLLRTGKIRSIVERTYSLGEIRDALRLMGEGHVQGKLVVTP
jgi:NADPH:quinone reductase-like Zn-dependent oxidoreductase